MRRKSSTLALIAAATIATLQSAGASAREPIVLAPARKWQMNYNKTTCTLARQFGSPKMPNMLIFERFAPTPDYQLTILSDYFRNFVPGQPFWHQSRDGEHVPIANVLQGKTGAISSLFIASDALTTAEPGAEGKKLRVLTPTEEATVAALTFGSSGKTVTFQTGPMDKPFAAMRKCTDELVRSWGLDPQQQSTLSRSLKPIDDPRRWIRSGDYPAGMLMAGKQALVNFRLNVDASGKPTACEIQRAYSDKAAQDVTCAILMRRAHFTPALDAKGQAVPSYFSSSVSWVIQL